MNNNNKNDIIAVFTLLDMAEYYDVLETAINNIKDRIVDFDNTYFMLWGEPYEDVDCFNSEKEANDYLLYTMEGKKKFTKYSGEYTLTKGEKYLVVMS